MNLGYWLPCWLGFHDWDKREKNPHRPESDDGYAKVCKECGWVIWNPIGEKDD